MKGKLLPRVEADERLPLFLCGLAFAFVAAAGIAANAAGNALFLSRYDASHLGYMYAGTALIVAVVSLSHTELTRGRATASVAATTALILAGAVIFLFFALRTPSAVWHSVAYFVSEIVIKLPVVLFWTFAAGIFDPRQAKRLFGIIGAAGTSGCLASGALTSKISRSYGAEGVLFLVAGLLIAFAVTLRWYMKVQGRNAAAAGRRVFATQRAAHYTGLLKMPQVRELAWMTMVSAVCLILTDYLFKSALAARYKGAELAGFIGQFYAVSSFFAILLQLFVVHLILKSGGVFVALSVLPIGLVLTSAGVALGGGFGWIVAAKFLEPVLLFTVSTVGLQLLYIGIRKQSRGPAQSFVDGVCRPAGILVAGIGIIIATQAMRVAPEILAFALTIGATAWLMLAWRNHQAYIIGLLESIGARRFDASEEPVDFGDRAVVDHLKTSLRTAPDEEIPSLLGIVEEMAEGDWRDEYRSLLWRETPEIRIAALDYLRSKGNQEDLLGVLTNIRHPDPAVRSAAIRAAATLGKYASSDALKGAMEDVDPQVQGTAISELINLGDLDGLLLACTQLKQMLVSESPEARASAARALATVHYEGLGRPLSILLGDPHYEVRRVALSACMSRPSPDLIPQLMQLLEDPTVSVAATDALAAFGPKLVTHLRPYIDEIRVGQLNERLLQIPNLLARTAGADSVAVLLSLLDTPDLELRGEVTTALCGVLKETGNAQECRELLEAAAERELTLATSSRDIVRDVVMVRGARPLCDALEEEQREAMRNAFTILGVLYPDVDMRALFYAVRIEAGDKRAEAVEALDNLVRDPVRAPLLQLLEQNTLTTNARGADEWIEDILVGSLSPWVVASAAYAAGESDLKSTRERIQTLLTSPLPFVREAALHAIGKLAPRHEVLPIAKQMKSDNDPNVRVLARELGEGRFLQSRGLA